MMRLGKRWPIWLRVRGACLAVSGLRAHGASLGPLGPDRLQDRAVLAELDLVVLAAPDRVARDYVHQVLLDEIAGHGCQVEFPDRPMSQDRHDRSRVRVLRVYLRDRSLLRIRGATRRCREVTV